MNYTAFKQFLNSKTKKAHLFILFFVAIIAIAGLVGSEALDVSVTNALTNNMPISGNAWSSNIGWVSFSGIVADSARTPYGVYENPTTGALSGYAWSYSRPDQANPTHVSGLGWLQFGVSDATHPVAKVNFATGGNITGYARFISAKDGSWGSSGDGWVSFSGTATNGSSYKVIQSGNCTWHNYAWQPGSVGWIEMSGIAQSGVSYGVHGGNPTVCAQANSGQSQFTCSVSKHPTQVIFTASPGTLSSYAWKLNGVLRSEHTSSIVIATTPGDNYAAQVSASVNGTRKTVYCPLVTIPTTSGGAGTAIIGNLTAYPTRVEEGNPAKIKFTWTLNNVKNTDSCALSSGSMGSVIPAIGDRVQSRYHVTNGGGINMGLFHSNRSTVTSNNNVSDTINTQTKYYIECNGVRVSSSVVVNVVPTFNNF